MFLRFSSDRTKLGSALVMASVLSALLQLSILSAASRDGNPQTLGTVALLIAFVQLGGAFFLSDSKSFSIRQLQQQKTLAPSGLVLVPGAILMVLAGIVYWVVFGSSLLACLVIMRIMQSQNDFLSSIWQSEHQPLKLALWSLAYFGFGAAVLLVAILQTGIFALSLLILMLYLCVVLAGQTIHSIKHAPQIFDWRGIRAGSIRDAVKLFATLSISGILNALPQPLLRATISSIGGVSLVGNFTVTYQILMLPVPFVTAICQLLLSAKSPTLTTRRKEIAFGLLALLLPVLLTSFLFFSPMYYIIKVVFQDFNMNSTNTYFLICTSYFMYSSVFLGFYSIRIGKYLNQVFAGVIFFGVVILGCVAGYLIGDMLILLVGFLVAAMLRAAILFLGILLVKEIEN